MEHAEHGGSHAPRLHCRDRRRAAIGRDASRFRLPRRVPSLRESLLLSAMTDGHVPGTKPRRPRRSARARRRLRLASVALPLVLLAPGIYYIAMTLSPGGRGT